MISYEDLPNGYRLVTEKYESFEINHNFPNLNLQQLSIKQWVETPDEISFQKEIIELMRKNWRSKEQ